MATGQYRSALSLDDVAQKTTLARSAHQNNFERTSKLLEEQCDEFVSLVSVRFQGLKTIDVIERNGLPKNSVALEPGDLVVDFVLFFSMLSGGPRWRQVGSEMAPSWTREGSIMAPRGPKEPQERPKVAPRWPREELSRLKTVPSWPSRGVACYCQIIDTSNFPWRPHDGQYLEYPPPDA